jgi:hypothetical protein
MAFKLSDFKKTARGAAEGRRLYPHQIRDERHTAAISYAVAYYERMVGERRAAFEAEALLEFFGDPRLARGLVACLARTYTWRAPTLAEALGPRAAVALAQAGVGRPSDLRARLYAFANARFDGFIPPEERPAALAALAAELTDDVRAAPRLSPASPEPLTPEQLERALGLDAEGERVLVRLGPPPAPAEVVDRYNFHSLETAICYAESVRLRLHGPVWTMLRSAHNLARRYRLTYSVGDLPGSLFDNRLDLILYGRRDALGGWGRAGRRLARAVLRLLAAHPGCAVEGEALSHAASPRATLRLDAAALAVLGAEAANEVTADAWEDEPADELQRAWGRAATRGQTAGWRLRRDPEPLVGDQSVVVPDFALIRGAAGFALCLAPGRAAAEAVAARVAALGPGSRVAILAHERGAAALRTSGALIVTYAERPADAIAGLVAALECAVPHGKAA